MFKLLKLEFYKSTRDRGFIMMLFITAGLAIFFFSYLGQYDLPHVLKFMGDPDTVPLNYRIEGWRVGLTSEEYVSLYMPRLIYNIGKIFSEVNPYLLDSVYAS